MTQSLRLRLAQNQQDHYDLMEEAAKVGIERETLDGYSRRPHVCKDCAFADLAYMGTVECRRFPPAPYFEPTGKVSNIRPRVGDYYWCGEFQQAVKP